MTSGGVRERQELKGHQVKSKASFIGWQLMGPQKILAKEGCLLIDPGHSL